MRIVEGDRLRGAVDESRALEAVTDAFTALAEGRAVQPPPLGMEISAVRGEVHAKGAYLEGQSVFALKVATGFYDNPDRGLPVGSGLVLVFDAGTGFPLGVLADDGYLTELRTGAAGALAARHLAPAEVGTLALVGAGTQARFQLRALREVVVWDEVRAWSPSADGREGFAREMSAWLENRDGAQTSPVRAVSSVREAVEGAGLIVTVTPSRASLVEAGWVGPGATVVAVGSDGPGKQELDPELLARADKVVVDSAEQCGRLGELQHALARGLMEPGDVHAELGDVVTGRRPGREAEGETIVCDLTGVGAQDAAIAGAAWEVVGRDV